MHKTSGQRDPAAAFPLPVRRDDREERRQANRAIAVSAAGLAATGLVELLIAVLTGSVGLLGDAIHNLSDVSTSAVVFLGFRLSRRGPTQRYPYGWDRAEDLAGIGIAIVIWASAAFAGLESVRKLLHHGSTAHVGIGIVGAVLGIAGNQLVARYKLTTGRRIKSATLIADARHSWLDALSSAGALAGLIAVAAGQPWGDPVAGIAVTLFICHVGYEVTTDVVAPAGRRGGSGRHHRRRGRGGRPARRHPRTRPGPLDRAHPADRGRGVGRSRPHRPGRRRARPAGGRCRLPPGAGHGQLHLVHPGRAQPDPPPRTRGNQLAERTWPGGHIQRTVRNGR